MAIIDGTEGIDVLAGTGVDDQINGFGGNDELTGNGGNDIIDAGLGDDTAYGNFGTDTLYGRDGKDTLFGGQGGDILDGGLGVDRMVGEQGDDIYYVDNKADITAELADGGIDTVFSTVTFSLANQAVENITLLGTANIGATGNFLNNTMIGNIGNNKLDGKAGADSMTGGLGNDTYYVENAGDAVIEDLGGGTRDLVYSSISLPALYANVEELILTGIASLNATGNDLANKLTGNSGSNVLNGGLGNDKLYGKDGVDSLRGGNDNDLLDGGSGDDILNGNAGRDTLTGGIGADDFRLDVLEADTKIFDTFKDFSTAEGDKIVLYASVFTAIGPVLDADELVLGTAALDANDFLVFDGNTGKLYYDADGNGAGAKQLIAIVKDVATVAVTDFEILV